MSALGARPDSARPCVATTLVTRPFGRLGRNLAWTASTEVVTRALGLAAHVHVARVLGPAGFGVVVLGQTAASVVVLASDLGVGMYGIRALARDRRAARDLVETLTGLRLALAVTAIAVAVALALGLTLPGGAGRWFDAGGGSALAFLVCAVQPLALALSPDWALRGLERFSLVGLGAAVTASVFTLGVIAGVRGPGDVVAACVAWTVAAAAGAAFLTGALGRELGAAVRPRFDPRASRDHLRACGSFAAAGVLSALLQHGPLLWLAVGLGTADGVGLLGAPLKLVAAATAPGFLLATAAYPVLADLYLRDRRAFARVAGLAPALSLALMVPAALVALRYVEVLVRGVLGAPYLGAVPAVAWLLWLVPLQLARYPLSAALRASHHQRAQPRVLAVALLTFLIGAIRAGRDATGLAAAVVMAEGVLVLGYATVVAWTSAAEVPR